MTYAPAPMTMPSVDCSAPYRPPRALIVDRLKQRFQRLERHGQRCRERYSGAQRVIRANEKRDTAILWQKVQEYKNKKGGKFKTDTRQKSTPDGAEGSDSMYSTLALSRLKRKLQLGGDEGSGNAGGYNDNTSEQQDPKKLKHDLPGGQQRPQEYPLGSVSVQIVQKFGAEAAERIETTVNVQSNGTMPDSQSVSVNVGSKNIKQETMNDNRRQQMNPAAASRGGPSRESADSSGLEDFLDQDMMTDGEFDMLLDWFQGMPEDEMDALLENQQMMSQSPQVPPQQMTSPGQQMTSPQHMPSPGQHMSPQGLMTSQSSQMQQQNPRMLCKIEKVDGFSDFHGNKQPENKPESLPRNPHGLTQQNMSPHGMTQQNISPHSSMTQQSISANIMTQQSMRVNNFSATAQQNISLNMSSSSGQQPGFPSNMHPPNNMSSSVPQGSYSRNMPPSSGQQAVYHPGVQSSSGPQGGFHGNMPMMSGQQGCFPGNMRPGNNSANNNNMTSQHIRKLNQVTVNSQFAPQEPPPMEPPRLFHPPTSSQGPQAMYERSQQLKQLAEKQWGMNGSASMNMTSDIRTTQTFPQYRSAEPPQMTQQMNMPSHPMSSGPGSQRLSHLDPSMYSRPNPQFPQNQQGATVSIMMQQSMHMQHDTMMKQRAQIQMQEQRQASFYNRMPDPSQLPHGMNQNPNFSNAGPVHQSWNARGPTWGGPTQGMPPQNHPQRHPSDLGQGGYLPELDLQSNEDLNILDEILSKK